MNIKKAKNNGEIVGRKGKEYDKYWAWAQSLKKYVWEKLKEEKAEIWLDKRGKKHFGNMKKQAGDI